MTRLVAPIVLLVASAAAAQPIPWAQLRGAAELSKGERAIAEAALRAVPCYHGCQGTIAACLAKKPRVKAAWRLGHYVIYLAEKSLTVEEIGKVIGRRRDSVLPQKVYTLPPGGAPRLGDPKAPVALVEFADFQCSHCAALAPLLERLVAGKLKGKVTLQFRTYPLRVTGPRMLAAQAALAAHRQGKFWEMARSLFDDPDTHTQAGVEKLAQQHGLKLESFRAALKDVTLLKEIEANKILGVRVGVTSTPALFVNGKLFHLPRDEHHLIDRVEEELELLEGK